MTERKPPGVTFESWIDKQIREATERGDFANLRGAGKPIPSGGRFDDADWWAKSLMRREKLSALPPSLALRKEVEDLPERVARESSERVVRAYLTDLNDRIRAAHRRPPDGPPVTTVPFDEEAAVHAWREGRGNRRS